MNNATYCKEDAVRFFMAVNLIKQREENASNLYAQYMRHIYIASQLCKIVECLLDQYFKMAYKEKCGCQAYSKVNTKKKIRNYMVDRKKSISLTSSMSINRDYQNFRIKVQNQEHDD